MWKLRVNAWGLALGLFGAGCGCAASGDRRPDGPAVETAGTHTAYGARFALPPGWTGGENDSQGYELTDGDLALMIGRQAMAEDAALATYAEERRRALVESGASDALTRSERTLSGTKCIEFSGKGEGDVEIRLLVARLDSNMGISFLMLGDGKHVANLDAAWAKLVGSLTFSPTP